MCSSSNMMAYRLNASIPTAKALISEGSSSCSQRGPDAPGYQTYRTFGMGAGGGRASFRQNQMKFPVMQPLSRYRDAKALLSGFIVGGSPNLPEDVKLESENINQETDICGRHFLFDKSYLQEGKYVRGLSAEGAVIMHNEYRSPQKILESVRLERTRTAIPPLPRDYHVHRPANLHPFNLSKELSLSQAGRPFTLGYPRRYEANTSPAFLFPTTLVLNGRNNFSVENSKLSRPKVNYPTYHPTTVKDNQKSQSYPDPMVGAPRSFIHRISELSSLEGETVRQENLKKMRKSRKPPS